MTQAQSQAQAEFTPSRKARLTQHQRIVKALDEVGSINPIAAATQFPRITLKLATRIGEMERSTGVRLERRKEENTGCLRYYATRAQIAQLKEYYKI